MYESVLHTRCAGHLGKNIPEVQREYMQFNLRFLDHGRITFRQWIGRLEETNKYLIHLPCLKDSPQATDRTERMNRPFSEHELAIITLRAMPRRFQDAYRLHEPRQPQELLPLRYKLEDIDQSFKSAPGNKSTQGSDKPTDDRTNKHRGKGSNGHTPRGKPITNKHESPTGKFCKLCDKFQGAKTSHNTLDCQKWDPQGNRKDGFGKTSHNAPGKNGGAGGAKKRPYHNDCNHHGNNDSRYEKKSFVQALQGMANLYHEETKRAKNKKRKSRKQSSCCNRDESDYSDSSDSS